MYRGRGGGRGRGSHDDSKAPEGKTPGRRTRTAGRGRGSPAAAAATTTTTATTTTAAAAASGSADIDDSEIQRAMDDDGDEYVPSASDDDGEEMSDVEDEDRFDDDEDMLQTALLESVVSGPIPAASAASTAPLDAKAAMIQSIQNAKARKAALGSAVGDPSLDHKMDPTVVDEKRQRTAESRKSRQAGPSGGGKRRGRGRGRPAAPSADSYREAQVFGARDRARISNSVIDDRWHYTQISVPTPDGKGMEVAGRAQRGATDANPDAMTFQAGHPRAAPYPQMGAELASIATHRGITQQEVAQEVVRAAHGQPAAADLTGSEHLAAVEASNLLAISESSRHAGMAALSFLPLNQLAVLGTGTIPEMFGRGGGRGNRIYGGGRGRGRRRGGESGTRTRNSQGVMPSSGSEAKASYRRIEAGLLAPAAAAASGAAAASAPALTAEDTQRLSNMTGTVQSVLDAKTHQHGGAVPSFVAQSTLDRMSQTGVGLLPNLRPLLQSEGKTPSSPERLAYEAKEDAALAHFDAMIEDEDYQTNDEDDDGAAAPRGRGGRSRGRGRRAMDDDHGDDD